MDDAVADPPLAVLIVDDEEAIRSVLGRYLTNMGYAVRTAANGAEALAVLGEQPIAAMLCDIKMPVMTGLELLPRAVAHDPDIAIIMLTAVGDPHAAIECLRVGAADYLIKPVDLAELRHAIGYALRKRELEIERRDLEQWLAREVAAKTAQLEEQTQRVETLSLSVLSALVEALEPRGPHGRTHSVRVASLSAHVAARLAMDAKAIETLLLAARIHDIGKLALREKPLAAVTAAWAEELVGTTGEADAAARVLAPLRHYAQVLEVVRAQHERWDGHGPAGLKGDAIPLGARVLAAVNLYDELKAPAEGTAGLATGEALANLQSLAGTMLDPAVLGALAAVAGERG